MHSLSVTHCTSCESFELASHGVVRRNKDEKKCKSAIVNLHTSSPNKMLLSKDIEKYGIEVSKLVCFVDFPISSFSLTDKALF